MFILDGLDEAPAEDIEELFCYLQKLAEKRKILLFCSCRTTSPYKSMVASKIKIQDTLSMQHVDRSEDVRGYVQAEVERWGMIRPIPSQLEQLIVDQLVVGSQGMFLWLSLQVEAICPRYTQDLKSEAEIFNILGNLPRNLPEAFDQALLRIPNHRNPSHIFKLVAAAEPSMSLDELRVAVNVEPGNLAWSSSAFFSSGYTLVSQYGGSLLDIDEEDQCVRLIHHSALLHLVQAPALPAAAPFHFDFNDAEVTVGAVCVTYLNYSEFENKTSTAKRANFTRVPGIVTNSVVRPSSLTRKLASMVSRDKWSSNTSVDLERLASEMHLYKSNTQEEVSLLLPYAKENWFRFTKGFSEDMDHSVYRLWTSLVDGLVTSGSESLPWTLGSSSSATEWAIIHQHGLLLRHQFLSQNPRVIKEALHKTIQMAREHFSTEQPEEVVSQRQFRLSGNELGLIIPVYLLCMEDQARAGDLSLLISLGCHPFGIRNSFNEHPVTTSAESELGKIARSLIPSFLRKPSSDRSSAEVAVSLMQYLPHVDALLSNGRTILHCLVENRHEREAQFWMEDHNADPNGAYAPHVPSPLQLALKQKLASLAFFLIKQGADVVANPDDDIPPLFLAISLHDVHLVNIMRKKKAHIKSCRYGSKGETALQFACRTFCEPVTPDHRFIADHYSPLYTDFTIIDTLLRDGADVNLKNGDGEPPIFVAARTNTRGLMRRLQKAGADLSISDENGTTLIQAAHRDVKDEIISAGVDPKTET